jgi:hypothetical protein
LANYYQTLFALAQHHKYSIDVIENLLPFERDIYVDLLLSFLNEKKEAEKG